MSTENKILNYKKANLTIFIAWYKLRGFSEER